MPVALVDPDVLAPIDLLDHAVWITDPDAAHVVWANRAGLAVWQADSLDELRSRELGPSSTIRENLLQLRDRVKAGERVRQQRTLFPKGQPTRLELTFGVYPFLDGRTGLLVEARPVQHVDPEVVRASEAIRYAPLVVVTFAIDGNVLQANVLARQTFGANFSLQSMVASETDIINLKRIVERGAVFSRDVQVRTTAGVRWYAVEARKIDDPVTALPAILVSAHDMTARIEAEQAKDDLLSVVSHELRTPITAIRGALELLAGGVAAAEPEVTTELLNIAGQNTKRLAALVDDLLDVRKLSTAKISMTLKACDLRAVLSAVITQYLPAAREKGIELCDTGGPSLPVIADERRIQQVLSILVSNAIKHTSSPGKVTVVGDTDGKQISISVLDEGPGIPEAFRDRIFHRFAQADSSATRSSSGAGLGLYIAKTLVELHGGSMRFDDRPEGGSVFRFALVHRDAILNHGG